MRSKNLAFLINFVAKKNLPWNNNIDIGWKVSLLFYNNLTFEVFHIDKLDIVYPPPFLYVVEFGKNFVIADGPLSCVFIENILNIVT